MVSRLRNYGPDHCLTYFPGNIPPKLRRAGDRSYRKKPASKLKDVKCERLRPDQLQRPAIMLLVGKLVERSKEDFKKTGCQSSRSFLLNENGMLEYYIELLFNDETESQLNKMRSWVLDAESDR